MEVDSVITRASIKMYRLVVVVVVVVVVVCAKLLVMWELTHEAVGV